MRHSSLQRGSIAESSTSDSAASPANPSAKAARSASNGCFGLLRAVRIWYSSSSSILVTSTFFALSTSGRHFFKVQRHPAGATDAGREGGILRTLLGRQGEERLFGLFDFALVVGYPLLAQHCALAKFIGDRGELPDGMRDDLLAASLAANQLP